MRSEREHGGRVCAPEGRAGLEPCFRQNPGKLKARTWSIGPLLEGWRFIQEERRIGRQSNNQKKKKKKKSPATSSIRPDGVFHCRAGRESRAPVRLQGARCLPRGRGGRRGQADRHWPISRVDHRPEPVPDEAPTQPGTRPDPVCTGWRPALGRCGPRSRSAAGAARSLACLPRLLTARPTPGWSSGRSLSWPSFERVGRLGRAAPEQVSGVITGGRSADELAGDWAARRDEAAAGPREELGRKHRRRRAPGEWV